jgi:IclR family acetate operon transcriptional repressor
MTSRLANATLKHDADAPDPRDGPRSLMRVLKILGLLSKSPDGMSLAALSTALASPKSSLLALLRPMVANGYLELAGNRYSLGPVTFQLSADVLAVRSFPKIVRSFLQELAERSNESVYLAAIDLESKVVTYIEGIESRSVLRYATPTGSVRPLFVSSAGRLLLALQDDGFIKQYLARGGFVGPVTGKPIAVAALRKDLAHIREAGYSVSINEAIEGAAGMAAPILIPGKRTTHAFMLAAPSDRFRKAQPELVALMLDVSRRASLAISSAS